MFVALRPLVLAGLLAGVLPGAVRAGAPTSVDIPVVARQALESRLTMPEARLMVVSWRPAGRPCVAQRAEVGKPISGSGRYAVKLSGARCSAWAWAEIEVLAKAYVTTRAVGEGELLEGAVSEIEKEVRPGRQPARVVRGARAGRALAKGQVLEAAHLESAAPEAGESIEVVVLVGDLRIVQTGRVVGCGRNKACALMPSGKHVEGQLVEGRLLVEAP